MRSRVLACLVAVFAIHGQAAELNKTAVFHALGERAPSGDVIRGLQRLHTGDLEAASKSLAKAKNDHFALYALAQMALNHSEYQKSLELLLQAVQAGKNSPWAELYVEQAARLLDYASDPKPFVQLAQQAADDTQMRPAVRDLLRVKHGCWLAQRGQFGPAAETFKPLQFVTQWALAGPLDNRDGAGFTTAAEPESLIDFEKSTAGRNRRVNWFHPPVQPFDGRMNLAEVFEPRIHVLAYAVTFVKAEAEGWAVLRAGCAGALAVFVNEQPVGSISTYHDFGRDKLCVPVFLRQGWNQILVKTAVVEQTEWAFALRLCKPEGGPLPGLTVDASATALAAYKAEAKERKVVALDPPECDAGLLKLLEKTLAQQPENTALLAAYGLMLDACRMGDKEDPPAPKQLAKAVALAPEAPHLRLHLAQVTQDNNEARQAVEYVVKRHPDLPVGLEWLAYLASRSELNVVAESHARQVRAKFGAEKTGISTLLLADILAGDDSPRPGRGRRGGSGEGNRRAEAERMLREFVEKHPYMPDVWEQLLGLENSQALKRELFQRALTNCGGDPELRRSYVEFLNSTGKEADAAEFLAAGLLAQPFSVSAVLAASNQYRIAGDLSKAIRLLENARQWTPENPDLLETLGVARHYAGQTPEGLALFKEVLRLKPNSPRVKDYVSQLDQGRGLDRQFFAAYDVKFADLPQPKADAYPEDNVVNILNQQVVRVNPNGSCSRMIHIVAKLLRQPGLPQLSQHTIYYQPERQVVDILRAAVITPDGRELSRADVSDRSTSAAMGVQTLIYDEHHLKQVRFKDLEPGSTIDLQYTIRDTGDNIYGDYFADTFYLSDDEPTVRSQYVLDYPKNLPIQTRTFNTEAPGERLQSGDPKREIIKWELANTPGIQRERSMPPVVERLAQLQVTTMTSWQEVGTWYWNLAKDQLTVNDDMRRDVEQVTKDCKTPTDKLRAIHDFAIRKIRYLGIEFGRNGYRPHKATETYKALYGDCKDTATLLAAMLPLAGIDCALVLIRTVNAGAIPANSLPMPNLYNHCIAYVPNVEGKDYWIDGTTDFFRLGELPASDAGAQVLVVDSKGGKFIKIPSCTPQENLIEQKFSVKVAKDGSAKLALHHVRHGQFAPGYREFSEGKGQYERYMKDYAAKRFSGGKIVTNPDGTPCLKCSGPYDQGPVMMDTEFEIPTLAAQSGDRRVLPSTFEPLHLSQYYSAETKRKHELECWYSWQRRTSIAYELDPAFAVTSLPEDAKIEEPFAKFIRKVTHAGQTVTIDEEFELTHQRITVAEYEKFRAFCNKVDSLLDQKVLLETK